MKKFEMGGVDLFGLDEFGNPVGLPGVYGALVGTAVQSGVAIAVRQLSDLDKWADLIGAGAGILGGLAFIVAGGEDYRHAGCTAIAVSAVNGLLRTGEQLLSDKAKAAADAPKDGYGRSFGDVRFEPRATLGLPTMEQVPTLGVATVNPVQLMTPAETDANLPASLLGADLGNMRNDPRTQQLPALNGPPISGLAPHFGATLFGGSSN